MALRRTKFLSWVGMALGILLVLAIIGALVFEHARSKTLVDDAEQAPAIGQGAPKIKTLLNHIESVFKKPGSDEIEGRDYGVMPQVYPTIIRVKVGDRIVPFTLSQMRLVTCESDRTQQCMKLYNGLTFVTTPELMVQIPQYIRDAHPAPSELNTHSKNRNLHRQQASTH